MQFFKLAGISSVVLAVKVMAVPFTTPEFGLVGRGNAKRDLIQRGEDAYWLFEDKSVTNVARDSPLDPHCVLNSGGVFCAYSSEEVAAYEVANPGHGSALSDACYNVSSGVVCAYHTCETANKARGEDPYWLDAKIATNVARGEDPYWLDAKTVTNVARGEDPYWLDAKIATNVARDSSSTLNSNCVETPKGQIFCAWAQAEVTAYSTAHPGLAGSLYDACSTTPLGAVVCAYHLCEN